MYFNRIQQVCIFLVCTLFFISPDESHAYTRYVTPEGRLVRWFVDNPTSPQTTPLVDVSGNGSLYAVKYVFAASGALDVSGDAEFDAIRAVFNAYQNVDGSNLEFFEESNKIAIGQVQMANDGRNLIFWDEDGSTANGNIPDDQIALTKLTFNPSTGELLDVDIRFNAQDYTWVTQGADNKTSMDITTVALHQIGRMIGLDTAFINASARTPNELLPVMFPLTSGMANRTKLSTDDKAGIAAIYPGSDYSLFYQNISGTALQSNGASGVFGAHVTVIDANTGNPVASTITGSGATADNTGGNVVNVNSGNYTIRGVPQGTYYIAVNAIKNGEVSQSNLLSSYSDLGTFNTTFDYEFYNQSDAANEAPNAKKAVSVNPSQSAGGISGINVITTSATVLDLADSSSAQVNLTAFAFPFFGQSYSSFFVHSDGFITFSVPDVDGTESAIEFFANPPKIAGLWDDLNPGANGSQVQIVQSANQVEVIFAGVPETTSRGANTFSITLASNGNITLKYNAVGTLDDGLVGISPGGDISNSEFNFSSLQSSISFQVALPIYEIFTGSGDDDGDNGANDAFDLDGATISFAPSGSGYTVSFQTETVATPTPTPTNTNTPTPTPSPTTTPTPTIVNNGPSVTINPATAELMLGESVIFNVTAVDSDSAFVTFTDVPQGTGTFGTTSVVGAGVFTTTYTVTGTFDLAGTNNITIFSSDTISSGIAFITVTVNVPPTPTPTFTPVITPSPTGTQTPTLPPNAAPSITVNPTSISLIVGETKSVSIFASDSDGDDLTFTVNPSGLGTFTITSHSGVFYNAMYTFTAPAGFEGVLPITISAFDGRNTVSRTVQFTIFAQGTTPSPTPTITNTATATRTPTITPTFTNTATPTPTMNTAPVISINPETATITEGGSTTIAVEVREPNSEFITDYSIDDPVGILTLVPGSFLRSGTLIRASYIFDGLIKNGGTNTAVFIASDGINNATKAFVGTVNLIATPTPTPVPQGDIVVAQGHGGQTFVHRREVPGAVIALNSSFSALSGRFAEAVLSSSARAVYVSTGDVDGDGLADIVTSFGPDTPAPGSFPNQVLVRSIGSRRVIGHSFNAFPHTSNASVNNPFGELRTAVGRFIPGRNTSQIAVAQGVGGNQVVRLFEYTGNPAPFGYRIVTQFSGLVAGAASGNLNKGLTLTAGDLTNDGYDELIVGQTNSANSRTVIQAIQFDANVQINRSATIGALPLEYQGSGGVNIAVGDLDGDSVNEVIAASMGSPDGVLIGETGLKNFVSILRPVTTQVFNITLITGFVRVENGVVSVFSNDDNPSGAVNVSVGDLLPGGGDELVFGTSALLEFNTFTKSMTVTNRPPSAQVRALRIIFNENGSLSFRSVLANNTGIFRAFVSNDENNSNSVHVGIRPFGFTSQ